MADMAIGQHLVDLEVVTSTSEQPYYLNHDISLVVKSFATVGIFRPIPK